MEFVRLNPFEEEVKTYPELPIPEHSYTCVFDGEIVAVGGVVMWDNANPEAWIIMTKQSKKNGIFGLIACRAIENKLKDIIKELNIKECDAVVRSDFPAAIRFIEALGFKIVRIVEKWFPCGTDGLLYRKVIDDN